MSNELHATARSASIIGLTALLGAIVGFFLQLLMAFHFGASAQTDAFFMAQSTSEILARLLMGGSITAVFIPVMVSTLSLGKKEDAWHLALNLLHLVAALFLILTLGVGIFAQPFIQFIAPGFDAHTRALTVSLLRVLLPSFVFLFLTDVLVAVLHAFKQFAIPAWLRVIAPAISVLTLLLFVQWLGIYALAWGVVLGSIIQMSFLWWGIRQQGLTYHFIFQPRHPIIKKIILLVSPFLASMLFTQVASIVYRVLVSDLAEGSLTALKFAEKITQLATIIFLNSVTMVIYPLLSEKAGQQDIAGMRDTIGSAIRLVTLATVPIVIGVALLRQPLITLVYGHGSFSQSDIEQTSTALLWLIIGLTINGQSSILGYATLALQKTRVSVVVTIASQITAIALFMILVPLMAHAGLALASSLVPLCTTLLYFWYLKRHIPDLGQIFWHPTLFKIASLGSGLFIIMILIRFWINDVTLLPVTLLPLLKQFVLLLVPALVGTGFFFGGAYLWHIPEMHELVRVGRRALRLERKEETL